MTTSRRLWKRLRIAWRFRVWPWHIPADVVVYLSLQGPTDADVARGDQHAEEHGWD